MSKNKKVVVAMSGGVDSSVAAALLLEQGYDIVGVFMKFWKPGKISSQQKSLGDNTCCSYESYLEAKGVAKKLGIKLYTINFEKQFEQEVVADFLSLHRLGVTPNPCIVCNQKIKFGLLLEKVAALKADFLATGHYAQIKESAGNFSLWRGCDAKKDQSYFLYRLTATKLARILFPVGRFTKEEVRELAKKFGLLTASRRESQEVCFIPDNNVASFLESFITREMKPGPIVAVSGKEIGEHHGLPAYTIGQRKGIKIGGIGPFYVVRKDLSKNQLVVTKDAKDLLSNKLTLLDVHWIEGEVSLPIDCDVKIRYLSPANKAKIRKVGRDIVIDFEVPQRAITPGQSAVFYDGDKVLGGGIIKN